MTIHLSSDWEKLLAEKAAEAGTTPEALVLAALREKYIPVRSGGTTHGDQWESLVRGIGHDCGISLSHVAVSSEGLYD